LGNNNSFVVFDKATSQRKCIRNPPAFSKECYGTLFRMFNAAFRKPPVNVKSNTVTLFIICLNFPVSCQAYGIIYRITGGFLNAATSILKRVSVMIFKISK
jgi:hypothetical protein